MPRLPRLSRSRVGWLLRLPRKRDRSTSRPRAYGADQTNANLPDRHGRGRRRSHRRRGRPQELGKPQGPRFPTAPTAIILGSLITISRHKIADSSARRGVEKSVSFDDRWHRSRIPIYGLPGRAEPPVTGPYAPNSSSVGSSGRNVLATHRTSPSTFAFAGSTIDGRPGLPRTRSHPAATFSPAA